MSRTSEKGREKRWAGRALGACLAASLVAASLLAGDGRVLAQSIDLAGLHLRPATALAQPVPERASPRFEPGEVLEFELRSSRFGDVGAGRMAVEGPVEIRGRTTLLLSMEIEGRVALFRFSDRTRSWYDPAAGASLRFEKEERHPLARREESVDLLVGQGRWLAADGGVGPLATAAPLDELSVLYHLRELELDRGAERRLDRHFDAERNPIRVRVVGRETVRVPAGRFEATVIEMEVRDPHRYEGGGNVIRIHLSDDARRLPLRIESTAPLVGTLVMTLRRWTPGD